ncbi:ty1-copia retrotransposon protein [Cucumis melo var. makuwa]|uniref:Ty1-copia retrotransposon protein n=1 Tax=Cucumis melo var. makuwa TaxID=1194695 RepID=A0A5A7TKH2_CUCMM|nr:ty1-copia retrotransposon protein [Cucumis melo var. makuwa]TYK18003.1 ty1-copia retrotransposon protein [Cucumis melo var. makuwa]
MSFELLVLISIPSSDECTSELGRCINLGEQPTTRLAPRLVEIVFIAVLEVDYVLTIDPSSDPPTITPAPSDPESSTRPSVIVNDQVTDLEKDRTKQDKWHMRKPEKRDSSRLLGEKSRRRSQSVMFVEMKDINCTNVIKGKRHKIRKTISQANLAEQDDNVIATIMKVNLIENKTDLILDTRASRHFCTNREILYDYEDTTDG